MRHNIIFGWVNAIDAYKILLSEGGIFNNIFNSLEIAMSFLATKPIARVEQS